MFNAAFQLLPFCLSQVERVTQEVPFTRGHCRLMQDAEEVAAAESTAEHVLEDAPADTPLLSAMSAHNAAAAAAASASAQVHQQQSWASTHAERKMRLLAAMASHNVVAAAAAMASAQSSFRWKL